MEPGDLYAHALAAGAGLTVRSDDGTGRALPLGRWLGDAGGADERLLDRAAGPVLDVGCGPGRHVHALARRGVLALGVDVNPVALHLARARGATVLEASIFDRLPGAGAWATALLLDGNVGIGGAPGPLLRRIAELLAPGGVLLVEVDAPGAASLVEQVRLEHGERRSRPFAWARVGADGLPALAAAGGLALRDRWTDEGRWFAALGVAS